MTNYSAKNVDEYISKAPKEAQPHLKELRKLVKSAVPKAEEDMKWGKPYYEYKGMLAGFDAFKEHIGFEIWADALKGENRKTLEKKGYKTTQRTFQIQYDQDVPTAVIRKMLKARAKSNEDENKE